LNYVFLVNISITTRLQSGGPENRGSILSDVKTFSLFRCVPTGHLEHPYLYLVKT
jgi:hypothetical protein